MEIKDIISSGLLEVYATGLASREEELQVQQWKESFPEIAAELNEIMMALESYAHAHSVEPSVDIKQKLFNNINTHGKDKGVPLAASKPAVIRPIFSMWKMVAAASVILLIASVAVNITTYNKYNEAGKDLLALQNRLNETEEKNRLMEEDMNVVQSKYSLPVSLHGVDAAPDAAAKIFWMKNTGEVFIDPSNLPEAPQGKQYQLWAIVDGKPVDGGMIVNSKNGDKYRIQKMKTFGRAEAFAVTLETEKGNPTPKGPMFVMGKM